VTGPGDRGGDAIVSVGRDDQDRYAAARQALSGIPLAVVIVGAGRGTDRSCATGTAMYVSFSPAQLAIALHPGSRTCALVESHARFSISVLADDQVDLAVRAGHSGGDRDKFAALDIPVVDGPDGTPAVAGAPARLWCRVVGQHPVGDHLLFIGEVEAYDRSGLDDPAGRPALVRHRRRYASIGEWLSDEAPEGYPT
jgi:flavin reductase (DIM6/NTAB) family NADH-FMN oxidoreductase RutF